MLCLQNDRFPRDGYQNGIYHYAWIIAYRGRLQEAYSNFSRTVTSLFFTSPNRNEGAAAVFARLPFAPASRPSAPATFFSCGHPVL